MMNIVVLGLWHLGCVTAACLARYYRVIGLDFDVSNVARLNSGKAPLFEPGLDEMIEAGLRAKSLVFTADAKAVGACVDVLWVCYDTPIDDDDQPDADHVLRNLRQTLPHMPTGVLVLISSQLPVGACAGLQSEFPQYDFAYAPENLRLGKAIEIFTRPDRWVVGIRGDNRRALLKKLFEPFTTHVVFMRVESAEMVKHALNSFLALSVTFINEIARLCELVGADAKEVSLGLKSDIRIGPKAYLKPGEAFAGGTLARDVAALNRLAAAKGEAVALLPAIKKSNDAHRLWVFNRLRVGLGELRGKVVAVLGLTYKPGTDTLRRSTAIELCALLQEAGATARAWDQAVKALPVSLRGVVLAESVEEALRGADAVAVCTEWPHLLEIDWEETARVMRGRLFVDANGFLEKKLKNVVGVDYSSVGCV